MLLAPTEFPTHPALREVARALCDMADPPRSGTVDIKFNGGKINQVLSPERELTDEDTLIAAPVPLSAEQWAVIRLVEHRAAQVRQGHYSGTLRVVVREGVPQRALRWGPAFVVRHEE